MNISLKTNTITNIDALTGLSQLPDNSIDIIFCDLPYAKTSCSWDILIPLDKLWEQYNRISKSNAPIILTASQPFTSMLVMSNLNNWKEEWIWEKPQGTNPFHAKTHPLRNHESILVFSNGVPKYNPQIWYSTPYTGFISKNGKTIGDIYGNQKSTHRDNPEGKRFPKTVQKFGQDKGLHPTQKNVKMIEYFLNTYSDEGAIVLDNCCGSGSTGVAAKNTNRNFILMDNGIDDRKSSKNKGRSWAEISEERINKIGELIK